MRGLFLLLQFGSRRILHGDLKHAVDHDDDGVILWKSTVGNSVKELALLAGSLEGLERRRFVP